MLQNFLSCLQTCICTELITWHLTFNKYGSVDWTYLFSSIIISKNLVSGVNKGNCTALVIDLVNWLHFLKYEDTYHSLIGCYFLCTEIIIRPDLHKLWESLHMPFTSYIPLLTLYLGYFMVHKCVWYQQTLAQLWGWALSWNLSFIGR